MFIEVSYNKRPRLIKVSDGGVVVHTDDHLLAVDDSYAYIKKSLNNISMCFEISNEFKELL